MALQSPVGAMTALNSIWQLSGLSDDALQRLDLADQTATFPTSFVAGTAAQASIGAAALAAETLYNMRTGDHQDISVARPAAELECSGYFHYNGEPPAVWEKFSGLYKTRDGFVRVHANFAHHRDGVLKLLGLGNGTTTERADAEAAFLKWSAADFEDLAAQQGLVAVKLRSYQEWCAHPQAQAVSSLPLLSFRRIGDAAPQPLTPLSPGQHPLSGVRVLDLTRILAGPICGRTLAAYGADVMLVNSPHLPNIKWIIDTSRGKRSAHIDLQTPQGMVAIRTLLRDAHVFVQGYRPGGMAALGLSPDALAADYPGLIYVSLSAYGPVGPWSGRRGFDSIVQTVAGFNADEAKAFGEPVARPLPYQIFDYAAGFLMAYAAQAALARQQQEGGSWHVEVSLLQVATWIRRLGRSFDSVDIAYPALEQHLAPYACDHGQLDGMPHAAQFSKTPPEWVRPSVMPGTDEPAWSF